MLIIHKIRKFIFKSYFLRFIWTKYKSFSLRREYLKRREEYDNIQVNNSYNHTQENLSNLLASKFKERNYDIKRKKIGDVTTYFFSPNVSWHYELTDDLIEFGPIRSFDYVQHGFSPKELYSNSIKANEKRKEMNQKFIRDFKEFNNSNSVDWLFIYANGYEILPETLIYIRETYGLPMVSLCLDDKHSWNGLKIENYRGGQIDIARYFDLNWTSSRQACDWYLKEGGCPILLPPGYSKKRYFSDRNVAKDIPISFLGAPYGYRLTLIDELRSSGIPIFTYGPGWTSKKNLHLNNIPQNNLEVIQRSQINLGCGNIGYSNEIYNIKGRDFDIPGAGSMYLTSYNDELAEYFHLNKEIVCYRNTIDLVEIIRFYLKNPLKCEEIAIKAGSAAVQKHRWYNRYETILNNLKII